MNKIEETFIITNDILARKIKINLNQKCPN